MDTQTSQLAQFTKENQPATSTSNFNQIQNFIDSIQASTNPTQSQDEDPMLIIKALRKCFQSHIKPLKPKEKLFNESLRLLTKFIFSLCQKQIIPLKYGNQFLDDIYECIPLEEIRQFFQFIEKDLMSLKIVRETQNNITMLKICNSLLKRQSKSTHNELRGRVQMLLSSILTLDDKSGLNKKSLINNTKMHVITREKLHDDSSDHNDKNNDCQDKKIEDTKQEVPNPGQTNTGDTDSGPAILKNRSFKRFWSACKYLANPFLLQEDENIAELEADDYLDQMDEEEIEEVEENEDDDELEEGEQDQELEEGEDNTMTKKNKLEKKLKSKNEKQLKDGQLDLPMSRMVPKLDPKSKRKTGLALFLRDMIDILKIFNDNPIEQEENLTKRYPKYLSDEKLFDYQIKEPFFRKTVLIQLKFFLYNLEHPLKCSGKFFPPLRDDEKKLVKYCDDSQTHLLKLFKLPNSKKNLNEVINRVQLNEQAWLDWKDNNCLSFDKYLSKDVLESFEEKTALPLDMMQKRLDREAHIKRWLGTDKRNDQFEVLNECYLMLPEAKTEPGLNYYFNKLVAAIATGDKEVVDWHGNVNKVFIWRALRQLYRDDISQMQNNNNSDYDWNLKLLGEKLLVKVKPDFAGQLLGEKNDKGGKGGDKGDKDEKAEKSDKNDGVVKIENGGAGDGSRNIEEKTVEIAQVQSDKPELVGDVFSGINDNDKIENELETNNDNIKKSDNKVNDKDRGDINNKSRDKDQNYKDRSDNNTNNKDRVHDKEKDNEGDKAHNEKERRISENADKKKSSNSTEKDRDRKSRSSELDKKKVKDDKDKNALGAEKGDIAGAGHGNNKLGGDSGERGNKNVGNRSPNVSGNGGNDRNSGGGNDKKKYDGNNGGGDGKFGKRAPDSHYHDDKNRKHQKRN